MGIASGTLWYNVTSSAAHSFCINGVEYMSVSASGVTGAVPTGAIVFIASNPVDGTLATAVPTGYLVSNGANISRTTYADLFAVIGTMYGSASGSTFKTPSMQGAFVRGYNDGTTGNDANRVYGAAQAEDYKSHTHTATCTDPGDHRHSYAMPIAGDWQSGGSSKSGGYTDGAGNYTGYDGAHTHTIGIVASGGTETRPYNYAFVALIKY
jgi:hypothetical protein